MTNLIKGRIHAVFMTINNKNKLDQHLQLIVKLSVILSNTCYWEWSKTFKKFLGLYFLGNK